MKAVILAGGLGTRLAEETSIRPKPMVEIGGKPILWHIMKTYAAHGVFDFVICCGYKGYLIKEYFYHQRLHHSDVTFRLDTGSTEFHGSNVDPWTVTLVDTGEVTETGGRLKRVHRYLKDEESFFFTYGDGLTDVDITETLDFHRSHGKAATVVGVAPPGRYGAIEAKGSQVLGFQEKPRGDGALINGGYFVLSPQIFDYIDGDTTIWEKTPMEMLAANHQMCVYKHSGFWQSMDTLREKMVLNDLWNSGKAPWKVW